MTLSRIRESLNSICFGGPFGIIKHMEKIEKAIMFIYRQHSGKNQFFVLNRKRGDKVVLTGHVEEGETPKQTAFRETIEEIAVKPINILDLKVKSIVKLENNSKLSTEHAFLVKIPDREVEYLKGKERHHWHTLNKLKNILSYNNQKKAIKKIKKVLTISKS